MHACILACLPMCVCVRACVSVCPFVHVFVRECVRTCVCACVHLCACARVRLCARVRAWERVCACVHAYVRACARAYTPHSMTFVQFVDAHQRKRSTCEASSREQLEQVEAHQLEHTYVMCSSRFSSLLCNLSQSDSICNYI